MKCNIVPLRQNWRDWELHHNKSNGYYCTHFSLSLSFFLPTMSLPLPPFTSSFILSARITHTHTRTYIQTVWHIKIYICLKSPSLFPQEKKSLIFTISSILDCPNGFQLPNLKANEVDAFLCPHTAF